MVEHKSDAIASGHEPLGRRKLTRIDQDVIGVPVPTKLDDSAGMIPDQRVRWDRANRKDCVVGSLRQRTEAVIAMTSSGRAIRRSQYAVDDIGVVQVTKIGN